MSRRPFSSRKDASVLPSARIELRPRRRLAVALSSRAAPGADTVLFIHGAGGRKEQWRELWPAFAARARLIAWDAPGHGDSPWPERPSALATEAWVEDALALLDAHGAGRTVVVAHSYGTRVALALLARLGAEGAAAALLLGPPAPGADFADSPMAREPLWRLVRRRAELEAGFRLMAWSPDADPALIDHEERAARRNRLSTMQALMRGAEGLDLKTLAAIQTPVTILAGADDRLTPPEGAQALAAALPNATCEVVERCGHQIMLERPDAVRAALEALLQTA